MDYHNLELQSYLYYQTSHLFPAHLKPNQVPISMFVVSYVQEYFVIRIHYLFLEQQIIVSSHVLLSVLLVWVLSAPQSVSFVRFQPNKHCR